MVVKAGGDFVCAGRGRAPDSTRSGRMGQGDGHVAEVGFLLASEARAAPRGIAGDIARAPRSSALGAHGGGRGGPTGVVPSPTVARASGLRDGGIPANPSRSP